MEELVRGHGGELSGIRLQRGTAEFNGGRVGVLHAAVTTILWEMEEKEVVLERAVLHPGGLSVNDLPERVGEAGQITEIGGGMDHDTVMAAILDERRFLELAEFDGRIDEGVVVWGLEFILFLWKRRRYMPTVGDCCEAHRHGNIAGVGGIHQDFREIEKRVFVVELRAERAGLVGQDFVFDDSALG